MELENFGQESDHTRVESMFLRGRNILLTRADFTPLFEQWRAHLKRHHLDYPTELLNLFQRSLGAFALHCVSRPRRQTLSWTINFQEPLTNLFLVGDTDDDTVAGRIFTESIAEADHNSFYQEVGKRGQEPYRSYINWEGRDPLHAAQEYYKRSEQRPARFFQLSGTQFAMLAAHPDWQRDWFYRVHESDILRLDDEEDLHPIETRMVKWECGCHDQRIFAALEPVFRHQADELFEGEDVITVNCPRCAAKYGVTREALENWVALREESLRSAVGDDELHE